MVDKLRLPPAIFAPLKSALLWIASKPNIVEIQDDQQKWFTTLFQEAMTYSPDYAELASPLYSLEYDPIKGLIELVLLDTEHEVIQRIPVVLEDTLPPPFENEVH